jgi:hypothetical protein
MWKIIETHPNYEVSSEGQVRNIRTQRILKCRITKGYERYILYTNKNEYANIPCHRLVALYHLPPPEDVTHIVDHIDRNKLNNNVSNLRWVSYNDNNLNRSYYFLKGDGLHNIHLYGKTYCVKFTQNYKTIVVCKTKCINEAIAHRDAYIAANPRLL